MTMTSFILRKGKAACAIRVFRYGFMSGRDRGTLEMFTCERLFAEKSSSRVNPEIRRSDIGQRGENAKPC